MSQFDKLLEIADSPEVVSGVELPKVQLHKWLVLGQTAYVCQHGTLSDGHDKFTPAQKYAAALKEKYYLALNIANQKAVGMEAQAEILDAEEALRQAVRDSEKLRAMARLERGKAQLLSALTSAEDQMRMLKFYHNFAASLKEEVESQYPLGIEQAEKDSWTAVAVYRRQVEATQGMARQLMHNVPLPPEVKAELGIAWNRPDMFAPLAISEPEKFEQLIGANAVPQISQNHTKVLESK